MTGMLFLAETAAKTATTQPHANLVLVFAIIAMALVFDFLNGFHDAANSIATIVATKVLTPTQAVTWAAFFNFVAAFIFGTKVAGTVGKGLVHPSVVDVYVVLGGLAGAIIWNIITWLLGLPTSSSHALVAGIGGAAVAKAGFVGVLIWKGWWPLLLFIVLSPTIGFIIGTFNMVVVSWLARRATPHRVDSWFRRLQLLSAAVYSIGHGGNDAQKTMGIIVLLLMAAGRPEWAQESHQILWTTHNVPFWIIFSCFFAIAMGTMFGGWRIVKTMGTGITKLAPVGGFCAESAAACTIIGATHFGIPVSTTHAITGSILGVGTTKGVRYVRWIWGQRIIMAWILTIPCSAFMAAITYLLVHFTLERWMK